MKIPTTISVEYTTGSDFDLEALGIDADDVTSWHIKWHTLHITHLDGRVSEHEGDEIDTVVMDVKRPAHIWVHNNWEDADFPNHE